MRKKLMMLLFALAALGRRRNWTVLAEACRGGLLDVLLSRCAVPLHDLLQPRPAR